MKGSKMEIKFIVLKNNIYQAKRTGHLVCNNSEYVAYFTFDKHWNGIAKTARFTCYGNNKKPLEQFDVPIIDGKCKLPPILIAGKVTVGVFGGDIISSNVAKLTFLESPLGSETVIKTPNPEKNVYNRLMTLFEKYYLKSARINENGELVFERGDGSVINAGSCDGVTVVGEKQQADWNTTDESDPSFVKNKPLLENNVEKNSTNAVSSFAIFDELSKKLDAPQSEGLDGQVLCCGQKGPYWSKVDQLERVSVENVSGLKEEMDKLEDSLSEKLENIQTTSLQPTPLFANDIDECEDTTKLYVLPDGFIYAYAKKTETIVPTNQIPRSIDKDGTPFNNAQGWKTGCSLNAGNGEDYMSSNTSYYEVTGFIPLRSTDVFRIKGFELAENPAAYDNVCFYDEDFAFIGAFTNSSNANPLGQFVKDDGTIEACIESAATTNFTADKKSRIAYVRLSCFRIFPTTLLTVNEPLETTSSSSVGWHNTGHAFVPADYENEIIDLSSRVTALETGLGSEGVEDYVVEEARRVAKNVYSHQNAKTFTFLAVSDLHYRKNDVNIIKSNVHAGQGMDEVRKNVNIDFAVCLGDNGWGEVNSATIETGIEEIRLANSCFENSFRGIPNFRTVGNHCSLIYNYSFNDGDYLDSSELFPLYGAYNRDAEFQKDMKSRGYCYRDFEEFKLRVICLNTSDISDLTASDNTRPIYVSGTQGEWFARTLDLSEKYDCNDWSILILSHAPLDWGAGCIYLCDILKAYIDGASVSILRDGITISYDYSGKNNASIIGNCHGHNHNLLVDNLHHLVSETKTEKIDVKRFCIPNACFARNNERGENGLESGSDGVYDIEYGEAITYEKTTGTRKDTAFNVVTVDVVKRKIYANCYGAGYDREISY